MRGILNRFSAQPLLYMAPWLLLFLDAVVFLYSPQGLLQRGILPDTDNSVYFVHALTWLQHGHWYDYVLMRLDPPFGTEIPYSRVLELMILPQLWLWRQWFDLQHAILYTAIVHQIGMSIIFVLALMWSLRPLCGRLYAALGVVVLLCVGPFAMALLQPGRVDHHALQIILFTFTLGCYARWLKLGHFRFLAVMAGLSILSLMIGQETLPWLALLFAALILTFTWRGTQADVMTAAVVASVLLLFPLAALVFVRHPLDILRIDTTSYSIVYAVFLYCIGIIALVSAWLISRSCDRIVRLSAIIAFGIVMAGAYFGLFPQMLLGPFGGFDPAQTREVLAYVGEAQPWRWQAEPIYLFSMSLAVLCAVYLVWRARGARFYWLMNVLLLVISLVGAVFYQQRMAGFANLFAVAPLTAALYYGARKIQAAGPASLRQAGVVCTAMLLPLFLVKAASYLPSQSSPETKQFCPPREERPRCQLLDVMPILNDPNGLGQSPQRIIASMSEGAHLLLYTISSGHSVFAAPYHTVRSGNRFTRQVLTGSTLDAESQARAHDVDLILLCRDPSWMYLRAQSAVDICHLDNENSLLGDLLTDRVPSWLQEIPVPETSGYRLFKTVFR